MPTFDSLKIDIPVPWTSHFGPGFVRTLCSDCNKVLVVDTVIKKSQTIIENLGDGVRRTILSAQRSQPRPRPRRPEVGHLDGWGAAF
jgi:hypothetical protein